jgi:hypothetical protein
MPRITIGFSLAYLTIGLGGYFLTGAASWTALIPAGIGLILLILGIVAIRRENLRKHAMHAALLVSLLVLGGTASSLPKLPEALAGEGQRPAAVQSRAATAVVSLAFLVLGIRSFIQARRSRSS